MGIEGSGSRGGSNVEAQPQVPEPEASVKVQRRTGLSRKLVVVIVVVMAIMASGIFIWAEYFGPRTMKDLASLVVNDPGPESPGFKHSLAGHKVTVKGEVTNITTHPSTLGNLSFIELDNFDLMHLVVWGEVPYGVGDNIRKDVRFEWSFCNNETHVYSPQLDFPSLMTLPGIGLVLKAVSAVAGTISILGDGTSNPLVLTVFDQHPELNLTGVSASLRAGNKSFAAEYIDVLGIGSPDHSYGREIDSINDLAIGTSRNGVMEFADADHDGKLSRNDTFTMNNLSRPGKESGVYTYVIILQFEDPPEGRTVTATPIDYFVMTSRGALSFVTYDSPSPYARIENEVVSRTQVRFTFASVLGTVPWDNVRLGLMTDYHIYGEYWYPDSGVLDNGPMSQEDLPSVALGQINAVCSVVDLAGNGLVDEGDYFTVSTWGGTEFSPSTNYTLSVIYEPRMEQLAQSPFHG